MGFILNAKNLVVTDSRLVQTACFSSRETSSKFKQKGTRDVWLVP